MSRIKRLIIILTVLTLAMLIIPLIITRIVPSDSGMMASIILFFAVNPIASVAVGFIAADDMRLFWPSPILAATLFWLFSLIVFGTDFPGFYSIIYLVISALSMLISGITSSAEHN